MNYRDNNCDTNMVNHHKVEGFDAFKAKVTELAATKSDVFVMFSGSKDADGVRYKKLIFLSFKFTNIF